MKVPCQRLDTADETNVLCKSTAVPALTHTGGAHDGTQDRGNHSEGRMNDPIFNLLLVVAFAVLMLNLTWQIVSSAGLTLSFF